MRKSSLGISTLLAVAAAGMSMTLPAAAERAIAKANNPGRTTQIGRSYRRIGNGFRYPEQSNRQAMRGFRRAQSGPGISLNSENHTYQVN
jgi:hypothetical protein